MIRRPLGIVYRWLCAKTGVRHSRLVMGYGVDAWVDMIWLPAGGSVSIHRYYMREFLTRHAADIRGHCLEFGEDDYSTEIGGDKVMKLDIVNIDDSAPAATIVADLTKPNQIPDNRFDCIVCTFVLHCIWDFPAAINDMRRILKPGGVLIGGVPCIQSFSSDVNDLWRFTPDSLVRVVTDAFGAENSLVESFGNPLTATADVRGIASEKFTKSELDPMHPKYPVVLGFRAVKPLSTGLREAAPTG